MALSTKLLKTRIKSIQSTKKITKAMELVAATKMRRSVNLVLLSRRYSELAWKLTKKLSQSTDAGKHTLLNENSKTNRVLMLLISSNRGLCGGYNAQIFHKAVSSLAKHAGKPTDFIIVGKKGSDAARKLGLSVLAEFPKQDVVMQINEIFPISKLILSEYMNGNYQKILLAFTDYVSALSQVPRVRQILPITEQDPYIGTVDETRSDTSALSHEYLFEPDAEKLLDEILPRLIEVQMYQAYMEANASEHSARMMAMQNATSAADDMIHDLVLYFNQARQAAITREIAEISSGKAVLE